MIEIDGKIVSTDIITQRFLCDLGRCKGICCVEGNAGAPLEEEEKQILADEYDYYKPFLTDEGRKEIERQGFAVVDEDGDLVTPLVGDAECAYSYNEGGVTLCAVERAWKEGLTPFRKPISCHLYPIRVMKFGNGTLGLNYHRWGVCEPARVLGQKKGVPMFRMLEDAIVRRFGRDFFASLTAAEQYLNNYET
jgi:hypothetical protein